MAAGDDATTSCVSCGRSVQPDTRFCPSCGFATDGAAQAPSGFVGVDAPVTVVDARPVGRSGPTLSLVVVVALIAVIGISALVGGGTSGGSDAAEGDRTPSSPGSTAPASPGLDPPTTTVPDRATTTARVAATSTTYEVIDGAPLLGRVSGRVLVFGTGSSLQALDLDTGVVRMIASGPMVPLLIHGDQLLVVRFDARPGVYRLPYRFDTQPEDATLLLDGQLVARARAGGDVLWVGQWAGTGPVWRLLDLVTGEAGAAIETPAGVVAPQHLVGVVVANGPEVVSSVDGGVFVLEEGGYRRVADGAVVATVADQVLVRRCDQRLECGLVWLDRASWEPAASQLRLPPVEVVEVSPGGRWLRAFTLGDERAVLVDRRQGEVREMNDVLTWAPTAFSTDERFLVQAGPGPGVQLLDLETGERFTVRGIGSEGLLLVDRPPAA